MLPLGEFGDDLLLKIFGFVLGPLEQGQYCVNNAAIPVGIKLRYEHLEPTHLQNFENIITLSQVKNSMLQISSSFKFFDDTIFMSYFCILGHLSTLK